MQIKVAISSAKPSKLQGFWMIFVYLKDTSAGHCYLRVSKKLLTIYCIGWGGMGTPDKDGWEDWWVYTLMYPLQVSHFIDYKLVVLCINKWMLGYYISIQHPLNTRQKWSQDTGIFMKTSMAKNALSNWVGDLKLGLYTMADPLQVYNFIAHVFL